MRWPSPSSRGSTLDLFAEVNQIGTDPPVPEDSSANSLDAWCPDCSPCPIAASVMPPTFVELLDTAIASVALPHIAGSLSATTDEATWVLTSYLVANAIILPASGWFSLMDGGSPAGILR